MGRYISNTNTSSYQDNELLLLKQGIAKNHKEFLTAGTDTWTIDHDVIARVRVWGGGGGGGGGFYLTSSADGNWRVSGAGGGAGGAAEAILRLSAGTYNITVGGGGAGGESSDQNGNGASYGNSGGSSSFHTYITCSGGYGGSRGAKQSSVLGGTGGDASFDWSGFDGLLYVDSQFGGNGGSAVSGYYAKPGSNEFSQYGYGSEKGEGESGGQIGTVYVNGNNIRDIVFYGGGGGGYNRPFIYGRSPANRTRGMGRGVGTGGGGSLGFFGVHGFAGQPGAVVLEWN